MKYANKVEFEQDLTKKANEFTQKLQAYMDRKNFDAPDLIVDSAKYSLFAGGKRIRPILTIEVARALEKDLDLVEPLAEAIEMIHSYSLIHDDLPAMDNARMRRGKKSNHLVFGEDTAILTGDTLLNMAIERALEGAPYIPYTEAKNYLLAMRVLFNNAGINGMIGGQVADTCSAVEDENYLNDDYIYTHKTGALISAAILCGCIPFFGMHDEIVKTLFNYSKVIGRIYQIQDDILDATSDPETLGKDTGLDVKNHKKNLVTKKGVAKARRTIENLRQKAYKELDKLEGDFDFLYYFTDYLCSRDR